VRNPILLHVEEPIVSLCLLRHAVDYAAFDGEPVRTLFTVISPTVPAHLRILAQLSLLLRDEPLRHLLAERAPDAAIDERIAAVERDAARPPAAAGGKGPAEHDR
jgi:PTS system nitrogen regulatory IIA component